MCWCRTGRKNKELSEGGGFSTDVLGDEALIAFWIAIAAEEDGLPLPLSGNFENAAACALDGDGDLQHILKLKAEAGGIDAAIMAAMEGEDGIATGNLRPEIADKDLLKTEDGGVKTDGAAHVCRQEHEFDFLWAHPWIMRGCLLPSVKK